MSTPTYPTYEEKILNTYGLSPAEFAAHEEEMRAIREEEEERERMDRWEAYREHIDLNHY